VPQDILSSSKKIKQRRFYLKILFVFCALFLLTGGIIGLFYLPKFRIKEVSVEGTASLEKEDFKKEVDALFREKIFGILPADNIFIIRKEKIQNELLGKFLRLKKISLTRNFPDKLSVLIEEREAESLWCGDETTCAFVDETGFIFEAAPIFSGQLFLKFFDERLNPSGIGKTLAPPPEFQKLIIFQKMLSQKDLNATKIILADDEIYKIYLSEGWYILLSGKNEPDLSFANLELVLDKSVKEKRPDLEYIDLRLDKKAFFKFK
jgi:cell division septal protein FtsQ